MGQTRYGAYAYFDKDGNLLEFISDKAIRQGNTSGQNKIYVYMENTVYTGKSLQCNYRNSADGHVYNEVVIPITTNLYEFALPTFEKYDPIHFVSGKEYQFIEVEVPEEVMRDNGGKRLSLALLNPVSELQDSESDEEQQYEYDLRFASVITFYVQASVIKYTETVDKSQFEYLLSLFGEYESKIVDKKHTVFVADSLAVVEAIGGWTAGQLFIVNETIDSEVHKIMYVWTGATYNPVFDFNDHYTKEEIDSKIAIINSALANKQDKLTTALPTAQLQYVVGFDSQGNLRKGAGGGGGGATYTAGTGIDITNFTISVDTDVVATKTFVNSSIATNTANFLGTYNLVTDLGLTTSATHSEIATAIATKLASLSITPTNNDYVFVAYPDATVSSQFVQFDRYKYNASLTSWEWEYTLNNSSFTAQQWAAINSGITATILATLAQTSLIAPTYDNTATYSVGAKCVYNGKFYTCTTAITQAEDFDATHWTEISVSSGFVDLDSAQTISHAKTLENGVSLKIGSTNGAQIFNYPAGNILFALRDLSGGNVFLDIFASYIAFGKHLRPQADNSYDVGHSTRRIKDFYIAGKIKDGTNEFNADNVFNVINASDMTDSTHFTSEQVLMLQNGKITRIIGTVSARSDIFLFPARQGTTSLFGMALCSGGTGKYDLTRYLVDSNGTINFGFNFELNQNGYFYLPLQMFVGGKVLPAYLTNNTSPVVFTQGVNNGGLSYKSITELVNNETADNTLTELSFDTISTISKSADTTFTLKTAPTGCLPEYKANITNSGASAIDLTFTGVSVIKTNDSNITIASNVLTLPAGTTIEVNIQNGKMIAFNWSAN